MLLQIAIALIVALAVGYGLNFSAVNSGIANNWQIVAGVTGGIIGLGLLVGVAIACCKRCRRPSEAVAQKLKQEQVAYFGDL